MSARPGKKTRGSIAVTFTFIVVSIFIVAQSVLWFGFLLSQRTMYTERLNRKMNETASLAAKVSSRAISEGRSGDLRSYIEEVSNGEDIINVQVLDDIGNTLASAKGVARQQGMDLGPFFAKWVDSIEKPVIVNGAIAGKVVLTFSGASVNNDMSYLLFVPPLWQILVLIIIVVLIFAFTNNYLGRPIDILKERIFKVTSGDLTIEIPDLGGREMGEIADGLRFLIKGLSANVHRLKHVTKSISDTMITLRSTFMAATDRVKTQSVSTNKIAGTIKLSDESQGSIKGNAERLSDLINENLASVLEIKSREDEMHGSMEKLMASIDNSYSVVAQMSQTSKGMMKNASRTLGSVENTSASVEEILASVREVETNARESSRLADQVRKQAAHKGVATVEKAINVMSEISGKVNAAVDIVRKLERRSNDVQKVLTFIKDITEKTNLLSINASILAEQAGEHGNGFAVVAEQMRSLSTGTEGYTREISQIVNKIQSDIVDVVGAIEHGNEMVKVGSEVVYEVGETMSAILESSHESANMTKMIERASEDQVLALRHIEKSIVEVNTMALEMDRAMVEMYRSSGYLFDNMGDVREVAEMTMNVSEDLVTAVKFISENLEKSAGDVSSIEDSIVTQKQMGVDILAGVESIRSEGIWIVHDLEGLSESIEGLMGEFDNLKNEMNSFRVK